MEVKPSRQSPNTRSCSRNRYRMRSVMCSCLPPEAYASLKEQKRNDSECQVREPSSQKRRHHTAGDPKVSQYVQDIERQNDNNPHGKPSRFPRSLGDDAEWHPNNAEHQGSEWKGYVFILLFQQLQILRVFS